MAGAIKRGGAGQLRQCEGGTSKGDDADGVCFPG